MSDPSPEASAGLTVTTSAPGMPAPEDVGEGQAAVVYSGDDPVTIGDHTWQPHEVAVLADDAVSALTLRAGFRRIESLQLFAATRARCPTCS